ncbi:choice-of-anchor L domain-containing protein [Algibacter miyuki]|uniref:Choice-of-anchor L domain-containing protein n=1 Tax=Algibacter miyuki TaxID=1306933 RepID=A0ABV5GZH2_9FLAO|nr:choice-of-anchor L domain-containing protein [Algibacter miyuki]MDN3666763.1 choice-of-anchor L domain-containing protein [Algibacter miyuki]
MYKSPTLLCFVALLLCNTIYSQQITIDNSLPVTTLVENNLVEGCVELSDIKSEVNGSINNLGSFGYFEKGNSNFPFANGIMLSTGNATSAGNSENTKHLNDGETNWGTDADLETALGVSGTLNATSIAFNFISASNQIQFNYILASEEYYANFPCDYSDAFAFLIREADSGSAFTNIAVLPGTSTPVSTNTVHSNIVGFCEAENEQYFNGYSVGDTNFNGRTNVLSASATITPNVLYEIKLVIADYNDKNYDSAVFIEGNSFSSHVDLGTDFQTCASDHTLNADINNPEAEYSWFLNNTLIDSANQPQLNITETGTYKVVIDIPFSSSTCTIEDDITITLSNTQSVDPISNYEICDDSSGDSEENFDLSTKNNEILNALPPGNYNISYHYTLDDSETNSNAISTPIQNTTTPQTIFVRTSNIDTGCLGYTSFDLIVNPLPVSTKPSDLNICDDGFADGRTAIDLSVMDSDIIGAQSEVFVTYYNSQNDADTATNILALPYTNSNPTETIYARTENQNTGCFTTTFFDIIVNENPVINTADFHYLDACDKSYDGYAHFDLTTIIPDIIQGLTDVTVTFHESLDDAHLDENAITDDTNFQNTVFEEQTLYVRVENNQTGCASFVPMEIHTNILLTATNTGIIRVCDIANDEEESFDLAIIEQYIADDLRDISVDFYETENDRNSGNNPLNKTTPYNSQGLNATLYITITSPTCSEVNSLDLVLTPIDEFDSIGTVDYCDADQDGFTTIDLRTFDADITHNTPGFSVNYFLTADDAVDNINAIGNNYTNTQNPQPFFTRITNTETGCYDTNTFSVQVLLAPESSQPSPFIICNASQDTTAIIDLTSKNTEIITDATERQITFYKSLNDAQNSNSPITDPTAYNTGSETIYARINNTTSGCYSTEAISVTINTTPVFVPISNYKVCENASDGFADFILNTKDAEILNGQPGKTVSYYLNEADAIARMHAIDKNSNYENISNPQTLFTRIENITDIDCFATSSFIVEVGTNPLFNQPQDYFVCDDKSNDAKAVFDLTEKITEISNGINDTLDITFYTSRDNAETKTNPVSTTFTNTANPQTVYAVIDNGTICNSITSFTINIIQAPEVNASEPMIQCDSNFDGFHSFNLTDSSVDILDVRQDNIEVSYFESVDDLESNINPISTPQNYTNTNNPQTLYVKVTNTISNCFVYVPLELIVNIPPAVNDFKTYETCDNGSINLTDIYVLLMAPDAEIQINYYANQNDADNNTNPLNTTYNYQTYLDRLYAKATNIITGCSTIYPFDVKVNILPTANKTSHLEACDDDYDGILEFDLTQQNSAILGGQNPNDYTISYYTDFAYAESKTDAIPNTYMAFNNETVFVRVENKITSCYSITDFTIIINPKPVVEIEDQVICLENLPLVVSANTNHATDSYLWSTNATTPEIEITEVGTYAVTVTTIHGCQTYREFNVSVSEQATIETTETVDFSDPNNITVTVSGIGNYAYALDDNAPQTDNVFRNVGIGYHTLTIIDLNGCLETTKEVVVIDTPKFMTPNNDGAFDAWHITGVNTLVGTTISIYDRYGKLLKTLTHTSPGWDGTLNGYPMPTGDYWYLANVNYNGKTMQLKGHFTLKR